MASSVFKASSKRGKAAQQQPFAVGEDFSIRAEQALSVASSDVSRCELSSCNFLSCTNVSGQEGEIQEHVADTAQCAGSRLSELLGLASR